VSPAVQQRIAQTEAQWFEMTKAMDSEAGALFSTDPAAAVELVTRFSYSTAETAVTDWLSFWQELFVTYVDGYVTTPDPGNNLVGIKKVSHAPGQPWADRIARETGDRYLQPPAPPLAEGVVEEAAVGADGVLVRPKTKSKLEVRGV
jgi:hypothetical protein